MKQAQGFTLLELLFALSITAVIAVSFVSALSSGLSVWDTGSGRLTAAKESQKSQPLLAETLQQATAIRDVSLLSSTAGFIQYETPSNELVSLYLNTIANQAQFGTNRYQENTIMVKYDQFDPEVLMDRVSGLSLTTYTDYQETERRRTPYRHRIASPNNQQNPVPFEKIRSLKVSIDRGNGDKPYTQTFLVNLVRDLIEQPGTINFGQSFNGTDQFLFDAAEDAEGFSLSGVTVFPIPFTINDDSLVITDPTATVKIRHSSAYFSTIEAALAVVLPGQDILMSAGTYPGNIRIPEDVRLLGGFDNQTWTRDVLNNRTFIEIIPGVHSFGVAMSANSGLDGLIVKGNNLNLEGVLIEDAQNVRIRDLRIREVDTGILIDNSSVSIKNSEIVANSTAVRGINESDIEIIRSKLESEGFTNLPTTVFRLADQVRVANCIIKGGHTGLEFTGDNDDAKLSLENTVIKEALQIGVSLINADFDVLNNVIHDNPAGIVVVQPGDRLIRFNVLANSLGAVFGISMPPGNTVQTLAQWNNGSDFFDEIDGYTLIAGSPLIDAGSADTQYNEVQYRFASDFPDVVPDMDGTLSVKPSQGTQRNDVGPLGGPDAGRIGLGRRHTLARTQVAQAISEASVLSGDHVHFLPGTHTVDRVEFRKDLWITGITEDTLLQGRTGAAVLNVRGETEIADLQIDANQNRAVIGVKDSAIRASGLVIQNAQVGLHLFRSTGLVQQSLFENNGTGIQLDLQAGDPNRLTARHNLFSNNTTALHNIFGQGFSTQNHFFNNGTRHLGAFVQSSIKTGDPLFVDASTDRFYLQSSSNALLANGSVDRDLGPFPFYVVTASATSPMIESVEDRWYQTLTLQSSGDPSNPTGFQEGAIQMVLTAFGQDIVLTPSVTVRSEASQRTQWTLPETALSRRMQIRAELKSHRYGMSPRVDAVQLFWGDGPE